MESDLYLPVKGYLESLGFEVKGEIGGCDVLALRDGEPPLLVVCELKLSFSFELVLQAVDRARACDEVWLAARASRNGKGRESDARFRQLCRRLGFGALLVSAQGVDVLVSPCAPRPRADAKRRSRLLDEHRRRAGDPTARRRLAQPDHDRLPAGRPRLRRRAPRGLDAAPRRYAPRRPRARDPTQQRLRLVRAGRTWDLRVDGGGPRGAGALAAAGAPTAELTRPGERGPHVISRAEAPASRRRPPAGSHKRR